MGQNGNGGPSAFLNPARQFFWGAVCCASPALGGEPSPASLCAHVPLPHHPRQRWHPDRIDTAPPASLLLPCPGRGCCAWAGAAPGCPHLTPALSAAPLTPPATEGICFLLVASAPCFQGRTSPRSPPLPLLHGRPFPRSRAAIHPAPHEHASKRAAPCPAPPFFPEATDFWDTPIWSRRRQAALGCLFGAKPGACRAGDPQRGVPGQGSAVVALSPPARARCRASAPAHGQCGLASCPVPQVGASHLLLGSCSVASGQLPVARPLWFPFPSSLPSRPWFSAPREHFPVPQDGSGSARSALSTASPPAFMAGPAGGSGTPNAVATSSPRPRAPRGSVWRLPPGLLLPAWLWLGTRPHARAACPGPV